MKISNHIGKGWQSIGWPGYARERWQWQPDLDAHDPNPPITIEDAAGGSTIVEADGAAAGVATVTGVGAALWVVVASSDGVASASAVGAAIVAGAGDAQGAATTQADAAAIAAAAGASDGVATALADGAAIFASEGLAEGSSEALAEGEDAQVIGPTVNWQAGGAGYPVRARRARKRIDQTVAEWVDELYADMVSPEAPKDVRLEAARIAKPLSRTPAAKVPAADSIDWQAFAAEAAKVRALLSLWEREAERKAREQEEDDFMMMGLL